VQDEYARTDDLRGEVKTLQVSLARSKEEIAKYTSLT
jgi:hypothetical protein